MRFSGFEAGSYLKAQRLCLSFNSRLQSNKEEEEDMIGKRHWYLIADQPAPAPHFAHPEAQWVVFLFLRKYTIRCFPSNYKFGLTAGSATSSERLRLVMFFLFLREYTIAYALPVCAKVHNSSCSDSFCDGTQYTVHYIPNSYMFGLPAGLAKFS